MNDKKTEGLDYEKHYYMMLDEMNKKMESQKEEYEKEIKRIEQELHFYKEIIRSVLNIR